VPCLLLPVCAARAAPLRVNSFVVPTPRRVRFSRDVTAQVLDVEPVRGELFCQGDEVMILRYHGEDVVFAKSRERRVPLLPDEHLEYSMPGSEFEAAT
jgi:hypothetical protein